MDGTLVILGILSFLVAALTVLQGLSMRRAHHSRNNSSEALRKLDTISAQLGRMEQRLNDCWDKLKE